MCLRMRSTNVDCVRIGRPSSGNLPPSLLIFVSTNAWWVKSFVGNGLRPAMRKGCLHRAENPRRIGRDRKLRPLAGSSPANQRRHRTRRQATRSRGIAAAGGHKAASIVGEIGEPVLASTPRRQDGPAGRPEAPRQVCRPADKQALAGKPGPVGCPRRQIAVRPRCTAGRASSASSQRRTFGSSSIAIPCLPWNFAQVSAAMSAIEYASARYSWSASRRSRTP